MTAEQEVEEAGPHEVALFRTIRTRSGLQPPRSLRLTDSPQRIGLCVCFDVSANPRDRSRHLLASFPSYRTTRSDERLLHCFHRRRLLAAG
jgi:hypothetical protein